MKKMVSCFVDFLQSKNYLYIIAMLGDFLQGTCFPCQTLVKHLG